MWGRIITQGHGCSSQQRKYCSPEARPWFDCHQSLLGIPFAIRIHTPLPKQMRPSYVARLRALLQMAGSSPSTHRDISIREKQHFTAPSRPCCTWEKCLQSLHSSTYNLVSIPHGCCMYFCPYRFCLPFAPSSCSHKISYTPIQCILPP